MSEEKTREEKAEVRPNPRFDWDNDEADKTTKEEEDFLLGTIHMIRHPNYPDLENRIWGEIWMIRQMNEVLSVQSMAKKPRQTMSKPGSITFSKANLEKVHHPHTDPLII